MPQNEDLLDYAAHLSTSEDFFPPRHAPPEMVYHYGGSAALHGVLKDNLIYATESNFLNDKTEFLYGIDIIKLSLQQELATNPARYIVDGLTLLLDHPAVKFRSHLGIDAYIFTTSYSAVRDDLNQWRAYGQDGTGYCFGIRPAEIPLTQLYRLEYNVVTQVAQIRLIIQRAFAAMQSILPTLTNDINRGRVPFPMPLISPIIGTLLMHALLMKHHVFQPEAEWRAIKIVPKDLSNSAGPLPNMFLDKRGERFVPRVQLPMPNFVNSPAKMEITVGPKQHFDKAKIALSFEIKRLRIPTANIDIVESKVPYQ